MTGDEFDDEDGIPDGGEGDGGGGGEELTDAELAEFRVDRAPLDDFASNAVPGAGGGDAGEVDRLRAEVQQLWTLVRQLMEQIVPRTAASTGSGNSVVVKITGNASGGGKFNGRILTGTSTAVASGTLAMPEGMTVPAADNALVLSLYENGKTTHDLTAGGFYVGVTAGTSGGLTVVMVSGMGYDSCGS